MTVSDVIRERLRQSGESTYKIAKDARVAWKTLRRFEEGANIRSDHLDQLAEYFGLVLIESKKPKGK